MISDCHLGFKLKPSWDKITAGRRPCRFKIRIKIEFRPHVAVRISGDGLVARSLRFGGEPNLTGQGGPRKTSPFGGRTQLLISLMREWRVKVLRHLACMAP